MTCSCDCHPGVYRALVTYSNPFTGEIKVKVPSVFGVSQEVAISYIGRSAYNNFWTIPEIGEQIIVTADDRNFSNIFWVQTNPNDQEPTEVTGLVDNADSVISFNNSTRTFTIAPTGDRYEVWVKGNKFFIKKPLSIVLPVTHGNYSIYFDIDGELKYRSGYFDISEEAPVSFIYWTGTEAIIFADERHNTTMDWQTHEYLHRTRGAQYVSGFGITGYTTTGTGSTVADAQISINNGIFFDEDIEIAINHASSPVPNTWQQRIAGGAYIPVFYYTNTGWNKDTATQFPMKFATDGYPYYNSGTSLTQMDNNRYGISWIVATNNLNEPIISIMGQAQYSNIGDAILALWSDVSLPGFPTPEFRPLWKIIFQATNGTAVKAAIRSAMDLRTFIGASASGGTTDTPFILPQVVEAVTTKTLTSGDVGKLLTSSANCTLTVDDTTKFAEGQRVDIVRLAGTLTVSQGAGATLLYTPGNTLRAINSAASIICINSTTNTYLLVGDLG